MEKQNRNSRNINIFLIFIIVFFIAFLFYKNPNNSIEIKQSNVSLRENAGESYFSNFTASLVNTPYPNCSVDLNMSPNTINNHTEGFHYSRNGISELSQVNTHQDLFENNQIEGFWTYLNQANGSFLEQNGSMYINDSGDHQWGGEPGNTPKNDAPALIQNISGDLEVSININTSTFDNPGENGGILLLVGSEYLRYFYTLSGTNSSGILKIVKTEQDNNHLLEQNYIPEGLVVNLTMRRTGNDFFFYYSLSSNDTFLLKKNSIYCQENASIGIYAGNNASLEVLNWDISPRVDFEFFNNESGRIHAIGVPFNQYDDDNYIQFRINGSGNEFHSIFYAVKIDSSEGPIRFEYIKPEQTDDVTPNIGFYMPSEDTGIISTNFLSDTCYFAYSKDGSKPEKFINPYVDNFIYNSNTTNYNLPRYWNVSNSGNLYHDVNTSATILHLKDINNSTWNATARSAPRLTQNLFGDFTAITKLVFPQGINISGGLILVFNDNLSITFKAKSLINNTINLTICLLNQTSEEHCASVIIDDLIGDGLWLKVDNQDNFFQFSYSVTGNTYNIYFPLYNKTIRPDDIFEVGLHVQENSSLIIEYWDITPSVRILFELDVNYPFHVQVSNIPFRQYSESLNTIRVSIENKTNVVSYSNVYYIDIFSKLTKFGNVLYHDEDHVNLATYSGELNRSIYNPNALDMEYLESGNILVTSGLPGSGDITEYDSQGNVTWQVAGAGIPLNWPHDADRLPNGNTLIADTGNDRAVEITPGGSIAWQWNAWDHFDIADADDGTSHLNDVDRLANGNTLIGLRNLDVVVEVTPSGSIAWSYGGPGSGLLEHPHNPDRLSNGNTMICDSTNHRILEVTSQGSIAWEYKPMVDGSPFLGWPRDADLLPNNHVLISDTRVNVTGQDAIHEIDRETGEVVWTLETSSANYEADVVFLHDPIVGILLPHNTTCYSRKVDLVLNKTFTFDDAYYKIHDDTAGTWINDQPVKYTGRTDLVLEDKHVYTLIAWANCSGGFGGGYPQDDSIQLPSAGFVNVTFTVNLSASISEGDPYPGTILLVSDSPPTVYEVDNLNRTIWSHVLNLKDENHVFSTFISSVDLMPNNHVLVGLTVFYINYTSGVNIIELNQDGQTIWEYCYSMQFQDGADIHDVDYLAETDTFLVSDTKLERAREIDRNGTVLWEWDPGNYFSYPSGAIEHYYHLNDADRLPNGNTLLSFRNINTVVEVNFFGDIIWTYGDPDNDSIIMEQHNPTRLSNNNTMICDSGNDRVIEVDMSGSIIWNTEDFSNLSLHYPRGAERLPNGNTLISDSKNARHIEIDKNGRIVWEFTGANLAYDADKIDRSSPYLEIKPILVPGNIGSVISFQILAEAMDLDTIWFNIYDEVNEEWMFDEEFINPGEIINIGIPETNIDLEKIIHLKEGNYSLHAWCKDTNMNSVLMTSDHSVKTAHVVIAFTLSSEDLTSRYILAGIIVVCSFAGIAFIVYARKNPNVVIFFKRIKKKLKRHEGDANEKSDSSLRNDDIEDLKLDFA